MGLQTPDHQEPASLNLPQSEGSHYPSKRLLFIEPDQPPAIEPILDPYTRRMCAAYRLARPSDYAYGGIHSCRCGALSTCTDHVLPNGLVTNSLCVHYLAHHRSAVSIAELDIIGSFAWGEADPLPSEFIGPQALLAGTRAWVDRSIGWISWWRRSGLNLDALSSLLRDYDPVSRQDAEDLFELLRNVSSLSTRLFSTIKAVGEDPQSWGSRAFQLPNWDREAWLKPMTELLMTPELGRSERRVIAAMFRHFRGQAKNGLAVLANLRPMTEGEHASAVELAMKLLNEDSL